MRISHQLAEHTLRTIASDGIPKSSANDNSNPTRYMVHLAGQKVEKRRRNSSSMILDSLDISVTPQKNINMLVCLGYYRTRGCAFVVSHPLMTPGKTVTGRWAYAQLERKRLGSDTKNTCTTRDDRPRQSTERVLSRVDGPEPYDRFLYSCAFETHAHAFSLSWTAVEM